MLPYLQLEPIEMKQMEKEIIKIYKLLMHDYMEQKELIPEGNLIEISFQELQQNGIEVVKTIYSELNLKGFENAALKFEAYLGHMKTYKKNKHKISRKSLDILISEWGFAFENLNYSIPENVDVVDD